VPLRRRPWFCFARVAAVILLFGAVRVPIETRLNAEYRNAFFHGAKLTIGVRQQIGQMGFLAALGGFRAAVADYLWIQAHVDWTRTEWGKMLLIYNSVTALQPRNIMFWEDSSWQMAYNASAYVMGDPTEPHIALRLKRQHEYFLIGEDLLERGIQNNPDRFDLYRDLGDLLHFKLQDYCAASVQYTKAASFPNSPSFLVRFAAYDLAKCPGHEREAYNELLRLYRMGEPERLPTLCSTLKELQEKLNIPPSQRIDIPDNMLPPHH
jgi:hypothetical protein